MLIVGGGCWCRRGHRRSRLTLSRHAELPLQLADVARSIGHSAWGEFTPTEDGGRKLSRSGVVTLLGAGASVDAGYPAAAGFLEAFSSSLAEDAEMKGIWDSLVSTYSAQMAATGSLVLREPLSTPDEVAFLMRLPSCSRNQERG